MEKAQLCKAIGQKMGTKITGKRYITDEKNLADAVANIGPIVVTVFAGEALLMYKGSPGKEIFYDETYKTQPNNHAVLLVGYNYKLVNGVQQKYWIIQNS